MTKISIVIPTLNEEEHISQTIYSVKQKAMVDAPEIIVVDSGSADGTVSILKSLPGIIYYEKPELKGRKYAILNFGASLASGEVLLFLDADSQLPNAYDQKILACLKHPEVIAGTFDLKLSPGNNLLDAISFLNKIRYRISKNFYGDQGLFLSKKDFISSGGYPAKPLMESAYYCRKLKKMGKLKVVNLPMLTSSRRFLEGGIIKVFFKDVFLMMLFNFRIPIHRFAKKYWEYNVKANH